MTINQRAKGNRNELVIVREHNMIIGERHNCEFSRNPFNQQREKGHADIVCTDERWPYVMEVKSRRDGSFQQSWFEQALEAAKPWGKIPVVAYKINRKPWKFVMRLSDLNQHWSGRCTDFDDLKDDLITMSGTTFFKIAEELYVAIKRSPKFFSLEPCSKCNGDGEVEEEMHDPTGFPYSVDVMVKCPECEGVGLC